MEIKQKKEELYQPKISIAISTYNRAFYLEKTLCSIKTQTIPPFEILVHNDGGTDNTEEIVKKSGLNIHLSFWKNRGLAACRNHLISLAKGDWILFLDDDDLLFPNAIETFQHYLQDPSPRILYGRYQRIDSEGKTLPTHDKYNVLPQGMAAQELFQKNFLLPSCTLLPLAEIRNSGLLFPEGKAAEDYDFFLKFSLLFNVQGIDERLVFRRRHKGNISSHGGAAAVLDQINSLNAFSAIAGERISKESINLRMSEMYARYAKTLKKDGGAADQIRNAWKKSLKYHFCIKNFLQMIFS